MTQMQVMEADSFANDGHFMQDSCFFLHPVLRPEVQKISDKVTLWPLNRLMEYACVNQSESINKRREVYSINKKWNKKKKKQQEHSKE